jgi:teichuronic acid exporter
VTTLKEKTVGALFWSFFERIGQQGIQFIIIIILARLLAPAEFGLIAMLTIFMAVAQSFTDSGFGLALVQKKDVTHVDECSIFYFNIFVGILGAGLLWLAAPWIADFYHEPLLILLTRTLSLNLVINAFGFIQTSLLTKRIDFKSQLKISLIATALSGFIGITLAYQDYGVWSLVAQSLSQNFFRVCLLWLFFRWVPSLSFSFSALRSMFPFGSMLLFSGLLETIYQNIYLVVIGKLFSSTDLGFYGRARDFSQLPVQNISFSVGRVTFPAFSSIQNNKIILREGVRKALSMMATLSFPMMIGLIVVARPLVLVLIGEKWLPCVTYLQLLCIVGILYPLHIIHLNVLIAQGRSDLFFKLEVLKKIIAVMAICITYRWGITAMIIGQVATSIIAYYLNSYYTGKLLNYSTFAQFKDVTPTLIISCIMGCVAWGLVFARLSNSYVLLVSQIVLGAGVYIGLCCLTRNDTFLEIFGLVRMRLR